MSDLIKREDAVKVCCEMVCGAACLPEEIKTCGIVRDCMKTIPAVDAVEVVHGEWLKMDMHMGMENYKCSVCRSECYVPEVMGEPMFPLCPYCGARMDGRREEEHNAAD